MSTEPVDRLRFAIVEDDPFIAELVGDMLTLRDVETQVYSAGLDLLKSPDLLKFNAIILDLSLPDIDGFEIMEHLADKTGGMSVLLMSGHNLGTLRAAKIYGNGVGLKIRGVLTKPFTKYELFTALGLHE